MRMGVRSSTQTTPLREAYLEYSTWHRRSRRAVLVYDTANQGCAQYAVTTLACAGAGAIEVASKGGALYTPDLIAGDAGVRGVLGGGIAFLSCVLGSGMTFLSCDCAT